MANAMLLKKSQLTKAILPLKHFELTAKDTKLMASFTFASHVDALVFIARITVHAEVQQHHPDILFSHQKVKITLSTHEAKGITKKDVLLAKKIEEIQSRL